jgi:hypothetical protein
MMAKDLTFTILGIDRASPAFHKVARSADQLQDKLDNFGKAGVASLAAVTGGAVAAGAGIAAALGGAVVAFAALGATAVASNEKVQKSFSALADEIGKGVKDAAEPLVPVFVDMANQLRSTFRDIQPDLAQIFATIGPGIQALTEGITGFIRNVMPGLKAAVQSSLPVMTAMKTVMLDVGSGVTEFFQGISKGSQSAASVMENLGRIAREALGFLGNLLARLSNEGAPSVQRLQQVFSQLLGVINNLSSGALPIMFEAATTALNVLSGLLSVVQPLSGALGTLIGVALSVGAAFRVFTSIRDMAAGAAGGISGFVDRVKNAGKEAPGFTNKLAALTGFLGGPFGIALAGASVALGFLGRSQQEAAERAAAHQVRVRELKDTLNETTGAITESTRSLIANKIASDKVHGSQKVISDRARELGISLRTVSDAALNQGGAITQLDSHMRRLVSQQIRGAGSSEQLNQLLAKTGLTVDDLTTRLMGGQGGVDGLHQAFTGLSRSPDLLDLGQRLIDTTGNIRDLWGWTTEQNRASQDAANAWSASADVLDQRLTPAQQASRQAATELAAAFNTLGAEASTSDQRLSALKTAMDALTGNKMSYEDAIQAVNEAFRSLTETFDKSIDKTKGFGKELINADGTINTTKANGAALRDIMKSLQDTTFAAADAMARNGATHEEIAGLVENSRRKFIDNAAAIGLTKAQAEALTRQYGLVPQTVSTLVLTPNLAQKMQEMGAFARQVDTLPDGTVVVTADTGRAWWQITRFVQDASGQVITVRVNTVSGRSLHVGAGNRWSRLEASGDIVEAYQSGGIKTRPMSGRRAAIVPPNTWRIIGDRVRDDEAFIPINNSPRSQSLLAETARRMGVSLGGGEQHYHLTVYNAGNSEVDLRAQFERMELMAGA